MALAIDTLILINWSFPNPVIPESLIRLTLPEIAEATSWMLFAPIYLHTNIVSRGKINALNCDYLSLYSARTLV